MQDIDGIANALNTCASICKGADVTPDRNGSLWPATPQNVAGTLVAELFKNRHVQKLGNNHYELPNEFGPFILDSVATHLIERVLFGVPAQAVAKSLIDIAQRKSVNLNYIHALASVKVDKSFKLDEKVSIVLPEELPGVSNTGGVRRIPKS